MLMNLRKVANHPLLVRKLYNHEKLMNMSQSYVKVGAHEKQKIRMLSEDTGIYSRRSLNQTETKVDSGAVLAI